MTRLRRTSSVLETSRPRLAGLKSIAAAPDFEAVLSRCGSSRLQRGDASQLATSSPSAIQPRIVFQLPHNGDSQ
jgi:hypothetical protein